MSRLKIGQKTKYFGLLVRREYVEKIILRFHVSPDTFPSFTGPSAGYFYLVLNATAS